MMTNDRCSVVSWPGNPRLNLLLPTSTDNDRNTERTGEVEGSRRQPCTLNLYISKIFIIGE